MSRVRKEYVVEKTGCSRLETRDRETLETIGIDPDAVANREWSYRMLLDAGLEETVAERLRRQLSLPWSFESNGELDKRSAEVRGLGEEERAWVAASADEGWQAFERGHQSDPDAAAEDSTDARLWNRPTPVRSVTGVGPDDADRLADAGINSAERLATVAAREVANALEINVLQVRTWRYNARELLE